MRLISIIFILSFLLAGSLNAQDYKSFKDFYKSNKDREGITSLKLPLSCVKSFIETDDDETDEILKKTKSVSIITADFKDEKLIKDLKNNLPGDLYKLLMVVKEGKETVSVKAKQTDKKVEEILLIVEEADSFTVLCVEGDYDIKDAVEFGNSVK
jgi:hypothetical protein